MSALATFAFEGQDVRVVAGADGAEAIARLVKVALNTPTLTVVAS